jgi:hypothetical protein
MAGALVEGAHTSAVAASVAVAFMVAALVAAVFAAEASAAVAFAAVAFAAIGSASLAGLTIPSFTIPMATIPTGTTPTGTIPMAITLTDTVMDTVAFAEVAFAAAAFAAVGDPYNRPVYQGSAGYTDQLVGQIQLRLARTALPHLLEVPAGLNPADLRTIHVGSTAQRSALPKTRRVSRTGIAEQITRWDRAYRLAALKPGPKEAGLKGRGAAQNECISFSPCFTEPQVTKGPGTGDSLIHSKQGLSELSVKRVRSEWVRET